MATPISTACGAQATSDAVHAQHKFRNLYVGALDRIDTAVQLERHLAFASDAQPGGIFDPACAGYLHDAEAAWDDVNDALSAVTRDAHPARAAPVIPGAAYFLWACEGLFPSPPCGTSRGFSARSSVAAGPSRGRRCGRTSRRPAAPPPGAAG